MSTPNRGRLSPVYLNAIERDLIVQALTVLAEHLEPSFESHVSLSKVTKFARSYTASRIQHVKELFEDEK